MTGCTRQQAAAPSSMAQASVSAQNRAPSCMTRRAWYWRTWPWLLSGTLSGVASIKSLDRTCVVFMVSSQKSSDGGLPQLRLSQRDIVAPHIIQHRITPNRTRQLGGMQQAALQIHSGKIGVGRLKMGKIGMAHPAAG